MVQGLGTNANIEKKRKEGVGVKHADSLFPFRVGFFYFTSDKQIPNASATPLP